MDGAGKNKTTLTFSVAAGVAAPRQEVVTQDIVKIGKDPKSHLRLEDEGASRMHAVVEVAGVDDITLIDLGNEPGTLVNGQRINKTKIKPGDEIKIVETRIKLVSAVPAVAGAPVAAAAAPAPDANPFAAPAAAAANPFAAPAAAPAASPFGSAGAPSANPFAANPFSNAAAGGGFNANPFAGSGGASAHHEDDPNAEYAYRLVKSGPDVHPDEVENAAIPAVEVMIFWGTTILESRHLKLSELAKMGAYYVGDDLPAKKSLNGTKAFDLAFTFVLSPIVCAFVAFADKTPLFNSVPFGYEMPPEKLGTTRVPVVLSRGQPVAVIPAGSKGTIELATGGAPAAGGAPYRSTEKLTIEEARQRGMLQPCSELPGAEQIPLTTGMKTRVELNGFTFQVSAVNAGRRPKGAMNRSSRAGLVFWLGSAALHGGIITALMMTPPADLNDEGQQISKETQAYMLQLQRNAADKEIPEQEEEDSNQSNKDDQSGGTGTKHAGAEGMMGDPSKSATGGYYQIKGPPDTTEVKIAKARALIESGNYGAIGALSAVFGSTANAPIAFDSNSDETIGKDPNNFNGNMQGDHPGDSFGYGGLGLTGTGPGGGGWGDGIGLGTVGGFGHGAGTGTGMGFGGGGGKVGSGRKTKVVKTLDVGADIQGRLPPDAVRRIVRANFPRFRACYEQGLKSDPGLKGTVAVRFIIDETGAVESANGAGGSLANGAVSSCVVGVYQTLSFPSPEGGKVMVTYPIDFENDDQ